MYQFKVKDSEIKSYSLYLGNIAEDFTIDNIRKTGLKGSVQVFHVDYNAVDAGDILDIHRYSVTETLYKKCLDLLKMFIGLFMFILIDHYHLKNLQNLNFKQQTMPS